MNIKDYLERFDVSDQESKLRILSCNSDPIQETVNLVWGNPKQLPHLSFPDQFFHLALCSNTLFMDTSRSESDYLDSLLELARVASEVRVAPVLDPNGQPAGFLAPVLKALQQKGYGVELREIKSSLKPHKEALLRLWSPSCVVVSKGP